MNKHTVTWVTMALLVLISSCGIFKKEKKLVLTQDLLLDNTATFIDGCKEKILGNYTKAQIKFLTCIRTDPDNAAAYYEMAGLYYIQQKDKEALPFIEKAVELNSENQYYKLLNANLLIALHRYKEATAIYEELAKSHPEDIEYFFDWAEGNLYMSKYQEAINVYDLIEKKTGIKE